MCHGLPPCWCSFPSCSLMGLSSFPPPLCVHKHTWVQPDLLKRPPVGTQCNLIVASPGKVLPGPWSHAHLSPTFIVKNVHKLHSGTGRGFSPRPKRKHHSPFRTYCVIKHRSNHFLHFSLYLPKLYFRLSAMGDPGATCCNHVPNVPEHMRLFYACPQLAFELFLGPPTFE